MMHHKDRDAHCHLRDTPRRVRPNRRVDDVDRRWIGYALVLACVAAALWWTL